MHLGRFHAVIRALDGYFKATSLGQRLESCAAALDNYASSKSQSHLDVFRNELEALRNSALTVDEFLEQPHSISVVEHLRLAELMGEQVVSRVEGIVTRNSFDHVTIATELRKLASEIESRVSSLIQINQGFGALDVEYEHVKDEESELGLLLPREIVGETLPALAKELEKFSSLFRALNEMTGATTYDPKVRTVSSSWWQFFVELDAPQIAAWVFAVERILALYKTNLEIKKLQSELTKREMPQAITDAIENEIEQRISQQLQKIAGDLRSEFAKGQDDARNNELENQLRLGLRHLATRLNQGSQIEVNVGIPEEREDSPPDEDTSEAANALRAKIAEHRARSAELRQLQIKANSVCTQTMSLDHTAPELLKYVRPSEDGGTANNT